MKLYEFPNGDTIHKYKKSIVILFKGQRNVLSTGPNNGGFTTDLSAVFNNDANPGSGMGIKLRADTYREHMDILAEEDLGLDSSACSGLLTAASMENAAISTLSYEDFSVTVLLQVYEVTEVVSEIRLPGMKSQKVPLTILLQPAPSIFFFTLMPI